MRINPTLDMREAKQRPFPQGARCQFAACNRSTQTSVRDSENLRAGARAGGSPFHRHLALIVGDYRLPMLAA
jgi:hypothetical protein